MLRAATVAFRFGELERASHWIGDATTQFAAMNMGSYLVEPRAVVAPLTAVAASQN